MNNQFSWKRFVKLFKKHTAEHYKYYFMSVLVTSGILILFLSFIQFQNQKPLGPEQQAAFFMTFFLLSGTIFTSGVFTNLSPGKRAITVLTLPASHFEKFLVVWIYSFLLFQVVYVTGFYLILYLVLKIGNFENQQIELFSLFDQNIKPYMIFLAYAFLHACTLLGAVAFKNWHFIKTAAILFAFGLLVYVINAQILKHLLDRDVGSMPFLGMNYIDNNRYHYITITADIIPFIYTLPIILTILLWTSSYFRLKEKQG